MSKIKALFIAANPIGTSQLRLDEEIRAIAGKIRAAEHRDLLELVSAWAVRADDLLQLLNEHKPHIVHFSGHGNASGEIALLDDNGASKAISKRAIRALFTTLRDNIRVVVLNACYSQSQAESITEVIDCAVGMSNAIGDRAAIVFAASFYRAIGFGRSIQEAFDQGRTALLLEGIPEDQTPRLLVRPGVDPSKAHLLPRPFFQIVENAQRVLRQPRKEISAVEQALYGVRALLYDLSEPSWIQVVAKVEQELSGLRDEILRAAEGATSSERAGDYKRAIEIYRSAIRRGFDEIIDDATGEPIQTSTALRRALEGYVQHARERIRRRYEEAQRALEEGYPNTARQLLAEAIDLLEKAERYGVESFSDERHQLITLKTAAENT